MTTNLENLGKLLAVLSTIKTPSFVRILNYTNDQGEISNHTINLGASYGNAKQKDAEFMSENSNIAAFNFGSISPTISRLAWAEMQKALLNPSQETINRSEAQTDAFITVCPNVRVHKETGRVFIYGFQVSKEILLKGVYNVVNSSDKTIAKNIIRKELKATKFKNLAFDKLNSVKVKGEELEITVG